MSSQNQKNVGDLVQDGRDLLRKASRRHVIVRNADGKVIVDISTTILALIVTGIFVLQPIGTFVAIGGIAYGLITKVKIEVVHELTSQDDVVEVNIPQD